MIRAAPQPMNVRRHVFVTLAALAVALKVLIPSGFMVSAPTNDSPFALVLCTSQGSVTIDPGQPLPGHADETPDPEAGHESPCAFAGQGAAAPPPNLLDVQTVEFVAYRAPVVRRLVDLAPGRGLSAPPLPARGPPSLLI